MTEYIPIEKILKESDIISSIETENQVKTLSDTESNHLQAEKLIESETKRRKEEMTKIRCCSFRPDWFVKDGLGITCSTITYFLIIFAEFVVVGVILLPGFPGSAWSFVHAILFSAMSFLAASSHLRAMTTNPGTIPRGNFTDENVKNLGLKAGDVVVRCTRCECIKTDRAHHCSTCKRCVKKMDHHCPWINNCVGETNQKYFVLFTFYIMAISAYAMILSIQYIFQCSDKDWKDCAYFSPPTTIIFIVFLIFEGLLFGLFTLVMFCTQINSVIYDETGIEHLKKESREKNGTWKDRLKETFGGDFGVVWFSPFAASTSNSRKRTEYSYYDV